jgi:hypothetical protein
MAATTKNNSKQITQSGYRVSKLVNGRVAAIAAELFLTCICLGKLLIQEANFFLLTTSTITGQSSVFICE